MRCEHCDNEYWTEPHDCLERPAKAGNFISACNEAFSRPMFGIVHGEDAVTIEAGTEGLYGTGKSIKIEKHIFDQLVGVYVQSFMSELSRKGLENKKDK